MAKILVQEIFYSVQGETSESGLPYVFIRTTGCDLRCVYCDSAYAFQGGTSRTLDEVYELVRAYPCRNVLLTGGEPTLQKAFPELAQGLLDRGYRVSVETHGESDLSICPPGVRKVMDIKTPGSGMCGGKYRMNLPFIGSKDELKFVLTSESDLRWAIHEVQRLYLLFPHLQEVGVLFSVAIPAVNQPGQFLGVSLALVAQAVLASGLSIRLQTQLHKLIWGPSVTGV